MATVKTAEEKAVKKDKVEIFVPKGYVNDEPNYFISVNGVNYLLPKGKKSEVPVAVANEFNRAQRAAQAQDERMAAMLDAAQS